jgi:Flp pilus assembly protein TadG
MTTFEADEGGAMALTTILLLPLVLVVLAGVLELGALRVVAERARVAADLATLTAVNDQDDAELIRTGSLRPRPDADQVARDLFSINLEPLSASLELTPGAIAASADVAVFAQEGAIDVRTDRAYAGPTVRLAAELPVRTPVFAVLLARPVTVIEIFSASAAR